LRPIFSITAHLDVATIECGVETGSSRRSACAHPRPRGANKDQHFVRDLCRGDPDLGAVDQVNVAAALGAGLQLAGFQAGIRLGHAKQAFCSPVAIGGSIRRFCSSLPYTTTGLRPKIFICTADAPEKPPGRRDGFHHDGGFGDAEARAA